MRIVGCGVLLIALGLHSVAQEARLNAPPTPTIVNESQPLLRGVLQQTAPLDKQHVFFDKGNLVLHSWNLAAETFDAVTTRRAQHGRPINELNPFAAVFVNRGWGGQIAFSYGFGVGGPLLTSYLLHRTGHHKLERWVPACNATGSTFAGFWNSNH